MTADVKVYQTNDVAVHSRLQPIVDAFFARRSPRTREAYGRALQDLASWIGAGDGISAVKVLVELLQGDANVTIMGYMAELKKRGLSPATMNQRLAAVKSMVKLARQAGIISWGLDVESERSTAYRDTRGPGIVAIDTILTRLSKLTSRKAVRDFAIMRMLFDLGLRRAELCSLDLEHLDLHAHKLSIMGKGRSEREALSVPEPTAEALRRWLELRGTDAGPLFCNMDRARKGHGRLSPDGLYKLVATYGELLGVDIRPHGVRHTAITRVAELTHGNLVAMASFSRHKKLDTMRKYLDNLQDLQGETASLLAGTVCSFKQPLSIAYKG